MSSASRAFSVSTRLGLRRMGATAADIKAQNPGKDVTAVFQGIDKVETDAERRHGSKAAVMKVQGSKLHKSSKDSGETQEVITVSIKTENGTRLESNHVRADGTVKQKLTRSGGSK